MSFMKQVCGLALAWGALAAGPAAHAADPVDLVGCGSDGRVIAQDAYVRVGGIEQWVTVRGTDCANPVILFVHGGPGNPMSPFADNIYTPWEGRFTLVQWDQRGAGRTFARSPETAEGPLSIERMAEDGVELAAQMGRRFGQDRIILMGGSWGSALGVKMARARPDLFHAYIGSGQLVDYAANQADTYRRLKGLAQAAGDAETVGTLDRMGPPPWADPRAFGAIRRVTRRYEANAATPAPATWWRATPAYATPEAEAAYEAGEDYSYLQFVGLKGDGIYSRLNLLADDLAFEIPVFLVQGEQDLVTTPAVAERYFRAIVAPAKAYVLVPHTGHDPNVAMLDAQYAILTERILPTIRRAGD